MNSNRRKEEEYSKFPNQKILMMLFYPYSIAMITSGFAAFIIIILGFSLHLAATVALSFFAFSASVLYFISKPAIKLLNLKGMFLSLTVLADIFAVLSFGTLLFSSLG